MSSLLQVPCFPLVGTALVPALAAESLQAIPAFEQTEP
jgi:hypothetical protein